MTTVSFGFNSFPNLAINDNATVSDTITRLAISWYRIVDLDVRLSGLTHAFSDDLDFLFVAPNGANLEFWSDAGGSNAISNGDFTISDSGARLLPDATAIASGTYKPTDYVGGLNGAIED